MIDDFRMDEWHALAEAEWDDMEHFPPKPKLRHHGLRWWFWHKLMGR